MSKGFVRIYSAETLKIQWKWIKIRVVHNNGIGIKYYVNSFCGY